MSVFFAVVLTPQLGDSADSDARRALLARRAARQRGVGDSRRLPHYGEAVMRRAARVSITLLVWAAAFRKVREGRAN